MKKAINQFGKKWQDSHKDEEGNTSVRRDKTHTKNKSVRKKRQDSHKDEEGNKCNCHQQLGCQDEINLRQIRRNMTNALHWIDWFYISVYLLFACLKHEAELVHIRNYNLTVILELSLYSMHKIWCCKPCAMLSLFMCTSFLCLCLGRIMKNSWHV